MKIIMCSVFEDCFNCSSAILSASTKLHVKSIRIFCDILQCIFVMLMRDTIIYYEIYKRLLTCGENKSCESGLHLSRCIMSSQREHVANKRKSWVSCRETRFEHVLVNCRFLVWWWGELRREVRKRALYSWNIIFQKIQNHEKIKIIFLTL